MGTVATLGGIPVNVSTGPAWRLTYGVQPYQRAFFTSRKRAKEILAKPGTVDLWIQADGYPSASFKGLYALQLLPGDENSLGVLVADARWLLTRKCVTRDYNIRKRTGDRRRVGNQLEPIQNNDILADVQYRRASLLNGQKWTAREILQDLMAEFFGQQGYDMGNTDLSVDVEGLMLDRDRGDSALARVLSYITGAQLFVDETGLVRVVNSLDGSEAEALAAAGPRYRTMPGSVDYIERGKMRPRKVLVQFEPEQEVRFNYDEDDPTQLTTTATGTEERYPRVLENVIPVVDPYLTVTGTSGRSLRAEQGTWIPVQDWITAVNAAATAASATGGAGRFREGISARLSMQQLRDHFLSGFQMLYIYYVGAHLDTPDELWQRRIAALAAHFRSTFRIHPKWMDRLRDVKAVRASILDQETGSRGKAEAFFDYFTVASRRNLNKVQSPNSSIGMSIRGYQADLDAAPAGPADVSVIDPEAGILHVTYKVDPWGDAQRIVPGLVSDTTELLIKQVATVNPKLFSSTAAKLQSGWKLAIVLTVNTGAPNTEDRLYVQEVTITEAYTRLPVRGKVPSAASGPEWTVGVSSGVDTARFMWSDSDTERLERCAYGTQPYSDFWLTNRDTIKAVATAYAASIYGGLFDRWEGSQYVRFNPKIRPTGSLASVTHAVLAKGGVATLMELPPILRGPDTYATLTDGARKILQRQVQ